MITFQPITKDNIVAALNIYNWYVVNTTATFHLEEVPSSELERMVSVGHPKYKSYLILFDGDVCGFCYISQFRYKEAYDKSAEITLYLNQDFIGKGIGKATLLFLEKEALQGDIQNLVAVITEGNDASIALFEKVGYFKVGHLKNIGEKFGRSLDVVSYQKEL
jgi:phosphinothricin acetyltransferase